MAAHNNLPIRDEAFSGSDHALARGAKPLARSLGFGRSFCPPGNDFADSIAYTMQQAVERSGLQPGDIGHVNAQGFSTPEDDIHEARAIRRVFGDTPVIAPTANHGNLGPGTGAVELAASVEACRHGILPPVMNVDEQDDQCPINLAREGTKPASSIGLTTNFTEHGQIACLVISA